MTHLNECLPLLLLSPVLIAVAWTDMRELRIPNVLVMLSIAIFLATSPMLSFGEFGTRLIAAAVVFLGFFFAFALRLVGGGDTKMIPALILFIPSAGLTGFAMVFSASLMFSILVVLALQSQALSHYSNWSIARVKGHMPMGLAIMLSGLTFPVFWVFAA